MAEKKDAKVQIKLGQQMDSSKLQERISSGNENTSEANIKLQNEFYGEGGQEDDILPVYLSQNETPAIKINPES